MAVREMKRVSDSVSEQVHIVSLADLNGGSRLFGGKLMAWIDEVSGVVARRHSGRNATTALVDKLEFNDAAHANDLITVKGMITYVGSSSMEVAVITTLEKLNGERIIINNARLVMVALDENEHPCQVPGLILETDEERERFEKGRLRSAERKRKASEKA